MSRIRPAALLTVAILAVLTVAMVAAQEGAFFQDVTVTVTCKGRNCPTTTAATAVTAAAPPSTLDTTIVVTVSGTEIGAGRSVNLQVAADDTAVYACFNKGGNHPLATNKATVSGPTSGGGTFTPDGSGKVQFSVEAPSTGPGSFACPSGLTLRLCQSTFTNVVLTDTTNGRILPIPGTFSLSPPLCEV